MTDHRSAFLNILLSCTKLKLMAAWEEGNVLNYAKPPLWPIKLSFKHFDWFICCDSLWKWFPWAYNTEQPQCESLWIRGRLMPEKLRIKWWWARFGAFWFMFDIFHFAVEGMNQLQMTRWVKFSCPLSEGSTVISKTVCIWLAEEISTGSSLLSHPVQNHFSPLLFSAFYPNTPLLGLMLSDNVEIKWAENDTRIQERGKGKSNTHTNTSVLFCLFATQ